MEPADYYWLWAFVNVNFCVFEVEIRDTLTVHSRELLSDAFPGAVSMATSVLSGDVCRSDLL